MLRIGLLDWACSDWRLNFYTADAKESDFLTQYASVFDTAIFDKMPEEGLPSTFRFCVIMPKAITQYAKLQRCEALLAQFFTVLKARRRWFGPIIIELDEWFDAEQLGVLERFLKKLPAMYSYVIDVRHRDFLHAGEKQQALYVLLERYHVARVYTVRADDATVMQESTKTSKNILWHIVATENADENTALYARCIPLIAHLLQAGKEVYLLVSAADKLAVPAAAKQLYLQLQQTIRHLPPLADFPIERCNRSGQMHLF